MEQFDQVTGLLVGNPVAEALADAAGNIPTNEIPTDGFGDFTPPTFPAPGMGGGLPFGEKTADAFAESAGEFQNFVSKNLTDYGMRTADAIRTTAGAYADAFQGLADVFGEFAPMPGGGGMGGDAPGMQTALALANGFDNLGEAVALSLGNEGDFGGVFAAKTIGDALTGAGEDIAAGFATGADIIEAIGIAIEANAPEQEPADPDEDGPEAQFVEAINDGFEALIDGYNTGAEALTGTLPVEIAAGITAVGKAFLTGSQEVTSTIAMQIAGFEAPGGEMGSFPPSEVPEPFAGLIETIQGGLEGGAGDGIPEPFAGVIETIQGGLEGGAGDGIPEPFAGLIETIQGGLEGGAGDGIPEPFAGVIETIQGGIEGGAGDGIPAPLAEGAAQFEMLLSEGASQLMDLPGTITTGISTLTTGLESAGLPTELPIPM